MGSIFVNTATPDNQPLTEEYLSDPNLLPAIKYLLPKLKSKDKQIAYAEFLARKVKRHPKNLNIHTQRINLNYYLENEEAYFGALIDLLIALGPKAIELKKSILRPTYGILTKEHRVFIKKYLHSGISPTLSINTKESRLSQGLSSTSSVIIGNSDQKNIKQPLPTARKKITKGDYQAAQTILENALEQNPDDEEITYELLELYLNKNMINAFTSMTTRLQGKTLTAQKKWLETEKRLSKS